MIGKYFLFVIPGRGRLAADPESITPVCDYGFRAHAFGVSRNDGRLS